jgi:predicted dehydrogenase
MIQALIKNGKVSPTEVGKPNVESGMILIKVAYSCVSSGTEVSSLKNSKVNLFTKVFEQPQKAVKYTRKIIDGGLENVLREIKSVKDSFTPSGYSASGQVVAVGMGVSKFSVGEVVAAAGGGFAYHAEYILVPENLVIKVDQQINLAFASTVALGGIALQGIRRADVKLGEIIAVVGVGLIGFLTIQLLKLSGAIVIAIELDNRKLELAKSIGADYLLNPLNDEIIVSVGNITGNRGCDSVLFTAATSSNKPLSDSFNILRRKGKLIMVGVSGMQIERDDIYQKEIDFLISTSYGPGRYDRTYEEKGVDYPYPYVRWTENRNMEEYCRVLALGLISFPDKFLKIHPVSDVQKAFLSSGDSPDLVLCHILDYSNLEDTPHQETQSASILKRSSLGSSINIALLGSGSFANNVLLPNFKKLNKYFHVNTIVSRSGPNSLNTAKLWDIENHTTDLSEVLNNSAVDLIVIANRHKHHFEAVIKSLQASKAVYVEKPLCTTLEELQQLQEYFDSNYSGHPLLTVGYNRRFSEYAKRIKDVLNGRRNPFMLYYRMNAGFVPAENWVHDDGGRLVGEACHIIDLMSYLTESKVVSMSSEAIIPKNDKYSTSDNKTITLKYSDGSVCNLMYFALGSNKLSKEYMEIHYDGYSIIMDDYKTLTFYGSNAEQFITKQSEKGHFQELQVLHDSMVNNKLPIELWDLFQTSLISLNV